MQLDLIKLHLGVSEKVTKLRLQKAMADTVDGGLEGLATLKDDESGATVDQIQINDLAKMLSLMKNSGQIIYRNRNGAAKVDTAAINKGLSINI